MKGTRSLSDSSSQMSSQHIPSIISSSKTAVAFRKSIKCKRCDKSIRAQGELSILKDQQGVPVDYTGGIVLKVLVRCSDPNCRKSNAVTITGDDFIPIPASRREAEHAKTKPAVMVKRGKNPF